MQQMGERTSIPHFAPPMHLCRPPAVSNQEEIIIIGAGLIGLCTADALTARGAQVTVIEAQPGPCEGTSFSNSGMIHPSQAVGWERQKDSSLDLRRARFDAAIVTARLAERSQDLLMQKMGALGIPSRGAGCLQLHPDFETAKAAQAEYIKLGIQTDLRIDPAETFGLPACYFPNEASGNARLFGCALAEELAKRGVTFIYDAAAINIRQSQDQFFIRTSKGIRKSDHLVIAAGAASPKCFALLGVRLQLGSVAGAAADFLLPDDRSGLPLCPIMDVSSRSALTVFDQHIRISGGWHVSNPTTLVARWREIAPDLMERLGLPLSTWSGVRPMSPLGRPYISATSIPNLWVNTGHGHMGWTLCAGSGELLAELLIDGVQDRRFAFAG